MYSSWETMKSKLTLSPSKIRRPASKFLFLARNSRRDFAQNRSRQCCRKGPHMFLDGRSLTHLLSAGFRNVLTFCSKIVQEKSHHEAYPGNDAFIRSFCFRLPFLCQKFRADAQSSA